MRETLVTLRQRAVRRIGHTRWAAAVGRRFGAKLDRRLYEKTGGKLTTLGGAETSVLLLTTTGRRTGKARTTPVIFVRDGESFIVSSENFGQAKAAAWPLNLDAEPKATVQLGSTTIPCVARRLGDAEADRYWQRLVEVWPAHETYLKRSGQRHTFMLTPLRRDHDSGP